MTPKELVEYDPRLRDDMAVLYCGNLNINLENCSYKAWFEQYQKEIEFNEFEKEVFNLKDEYAGRLDAVGTHKGRKTLFDFKGGSSGEFKQLAAYAMCDGIEVEQLALCHIGKTDNKKGYIAIKVEPDIKKHYQDFLKDRYIFRERFGI